MGRVDARTVNALLAVAACVAGLVALYLAAFVVPVTEHADQRVFDAFLSLQHLRTATLAGLRHQLLRPRARTRSRCWR